MAIYIYNCPKCLTQIEIRHKMSDKSQHKCTICDTILEKDLGLSSKPIFGFRGFGFYDTDYKKKSSSDG